MIFKHDTFIIPCGGIMILLFILDMHGTYFWIYKFILVLPLLINKCNATSKLGFSKAYISYFLMTSDYSTNNDKLERSLLFVFEKLVGGCLLFINVFQYWTLLNTFWKWKLKLKKSITFSLNSMHFIFFILRK